MLAEVIRLVPNGSRIHQLASVLSELRRLVNIGALVSEALRNVIHTAETRIKQSNSWTPTTQFLPPAHHRKTCCNTHRAFRQAREKKMKVQSSTDFAAFKAQTPRQRRKINAEILCRFTDQREEHRDSNPLRHSFGPESQRPEELPPQFTERVDVSAFHSRPLQKTFALHP